jgi:hypothetical protein
MSCHRCRGLLVRETFGDLREKTGCMFPATRCINCGYIEDSVVRANRFSPPAAKQAAPRRMARKLRLLFLQPTLKRIAPYERKVRILATLFPIYGGI